MNQGTIAQQIDLDVKNQAFEMAKGRVNPIRDQIILAQPLANNGPKLILPLYNDDQTGTTGITLEKRLNRQDVFLASRIGFFLAKSASVAALKDATFYTYDNAAGLDTATATGLKAVYNRGYLNWKIGNTESLGNYPLKKHYRVPTLQQGDVLATDGQASVTTYDVSLDGQSFEENFLSIFPQAKWIINGGDDNEYSLNLPGGTVAPGSGANYAILIFDGWTVKGMAQSLSQK